MSIRVLLQDSPTRSIALATDTHALVFRHNPEVLTNGYTGGLTSASQTSLSTISSATGRGGTPKCMVEFCSISDIDLSDYRPLTATGQGAHGTLGLITVEKDVFLAVVTGASKVATVRKGENVLRIHAVEFHCLNRSDWDHMLYGQVNPYPTDTLDEEGWEQGFDQNKGDGILEHPCLAIRKLLSSGTFYYSADFDLTRRLQERSMDSTQVVTFDSLDAGFLWNSYMIQPLVDFRSRLSQREKTSLDASKLLTSAIRGFVHTINIPPSSSPARTAPAGLPSTLTLISRLSSRRAGTRFNSRGIDDDGNVANFVETETVFCTPAGLVFSYTQIRGSVPVFWEQQTGLLPGQQKVSITRSEEATQPAFDKHFEHLEYSYGNIHIVNLLGMDRPQETDLIRRYRHHIKYSSLKPNGNNNGHEHLTHTDYDFHAETKGPAGYEAASGIARYINNSADSFAYYLSEEVEEHPMTGDHPSPERIRRPVTILQQEGAFRTNCLDCLDRTNLVQTIISKLGLMAFLAHRGERAKSDFWVRHGSLWADNGDALSKIYAGTGALKSSFTRNGKMNFAGALADVRKSATRMYINNFADKGRQNTIDMLLGRLMGQSPVHLYDPINDWVLNELNKREAEYTSRDTISIQVGTFNLNGKTQGLRVDLSSWICPPVDPSQQFPEIVAIGFQEIVDLSPQQIMATDPARRQDWEAAVKKTLNDHAQMAGQEEYVMLRGGQLVGASLSLFVKASVLPLIKNVEGSLKKTGMSGMAGNKGAVAIRVEFANTAICFVTAHLAAGFANYDERNRDFKTISQGLRFARNRTIEDHDTIIWFGDFNYRIGLANEKVRKLTEVGDLETLYTNDQLNLQMVAGLAFPFYNEARITFMPTYKYDVATDTYDTSEKARIPAWCDRVLTKGNNIRQINYNTAPLRFSDHRPVYATFICSISIIDEKVKEQLGMQLYRQRKGAIGDPTANGTLLDESDDEDLVGYESVEPGLPPASSDKRKWWLDNSQPARSKIQPPGNGFAPNPSRPSNPWTPSSEPDWVDIRKADCSSPGITRINSNQTMPVSSPTSRRLPPPWNPGVDNTLDSHKALRPTPPPSRVPHTGLGRSPSVTSTRSLPNRSRSPSQLSVNSTSTSTTLIPRKPAPPIPKKPTGLTSLSPEPIQESEPARKDVPFPPPPRRSTQPNAVSHSTGGPSGTGSGLKKQIVPPIPPPARKPVRSGSGNTAKGSGSGSGGGVKSPSQQLQEEMAPKLPPRTGTGGSEQLEQGKSKQAGGLMDEEGLDDLKGWEVLKPGK